MKFTSSIVILLFALTLARPVSGDRTCQQENLLLNRRIEGLSHRNRELLYTLNQKKSTGLFGLNFYFDHNMIHTIVIHAYLYRIWSKAKQVCLVCSCT